MILNNFKLDSYTKIVNKPDLVMFESNEDILGNKIEIVVRSCKKSKFPLFEISCRIGFMTTGNDRYGFSGLSYNDFRHHKLIYDGLTRTIELMVGFMGSMIWELGDETNES